MIKYQVIKNSKVLFIGINPHNGSFKNGVPFSNNKMFWYLLNRSGVINEKTEDLKDVKRLRGIYKNKFSKVYGLSLLNVINRPSRDVTQLQKGEESGGRRRIMAAIKNCKPRVVCFIGKVAFQKFSEEKSVMFGWQKPINNTKVYVMHFPLRGAAIVRIRELKRIMKKCA